MDNKENKKEEYVSKNYIKPIYCYSSERNDCYGGCDPACDFKDECYDD